MSLNASVQAFVASQPQYTLRRIILRGLIRSIVFRILGRVSVVGEEHIPTTGPAVLMMNHLTLLDPVLCLGAVTKRFVVPMSKVENLDHPIMGTLVRNWGAFTIERGEVDRKALLSAIELARSGQLILIAPEGTRQEVGLAEAKEGLAYVATKANAVVIPAAVSGVADWGINALRLKRPKMQVTFGRPFRFRTQGDGRVPREALRAMTHEAMYQLALALPNSPLRGVYADVSRATTTYLDFVHPA
jgi:1-acyl-sn-glycerol-3-phosphate acyltransferase